MSSIAHRVVSTNVTAFAEFACHLLVLLVLKVLVGGTLSRRDQFRKRTKTAFITSHPECPARGWDQMHGKPERIIQAVIVLICGPCAAFQLAFSAAWESAKLSPWRSAGGRAYAVLE